MVFLIGMPEMTFISSSCRPNCCNFSTPSEAGSISLNMARSVVTSDIIKPLLLHLAESGNFGFTNLADEVSFLTFLHFPDRDQRNDARSQHIQQQEQGKCTYCHR